MESLYSSWNHRRILKEACRGLKKIKGMTLQQIAERVGVAPPYLSNVLAEKAYLSNDQAFRISQTLEWSETDTQHLIHLMEFERSGDAKRRQVLKELIEKQRTEHLKPKQHLQKTNVESLREEETRYFLNPMLKIIHGLLGIKKFNESADLIAQKLRLSKEQVQLHLKELESLGFIKKREGRYEKLKKNFHLPQESPLCGPHQKLFQALASQHALSLSPEDHFQFMVTFSANHEVQMKIREELMQFLKTIEKLVKEAPSEDLYELRIDLFPWSR